MDCRRGQAVVMVTLALFLLLGMLGLAVDLGYAYFVKKSAQAAVDTAALAAANEAFRHGGQAGSFRCSADLECVPTSAEGQRQPIPCPITSGSNLTNGCQYAERNGFRTAGRQMVTVDSGSWDGVTPVAPPTAPGLRVYYWVTFRAVERIPQLFSAALGNTSADSTARATAAVIDAPLKASLIVLNRQNDTWGAGPERNRNTGVDISGSGNATIYGGEGIYLASAANGSGVGTFAGDADTGGGGGSVIVRAPFTHIRDQGAVNPVLDWGSTDPGVPAWENGFGDSRDFWDPMRGFGQPPAPTGLTDCPILDGQIAGPALGTAPPLVLGPGNYYAIDSRTGLATGQPIRVSGDVRFAASGSCGSGVRADNGFGNYVFFGGMWFPSTHTVATFEPGRYVLAGVLEQGNNPNPILKFANQVKLQDHTTEALGAGHEHLEGNAGEIFIFTDGTYGGRLSIPTDPAFQSIQDQLKFGYVDLQTGNNEGTLIDLHGLNNDRANSGYTTVPSSLDDFRPVVFWQDQRNSSVRYTSDGYIDCGQGLPGTNDCDGSHSLDNPYYTNITSDSPKMMLQAGPYTNLYGTVYQPRGAWLDLQGGPNTENELQLITGALNVHGGGLVRLRPVTSPMLRKIVALVE